MKTILVGLAGNPNAGKTTLFNAMTGAKQHVGNWPGKTVEKKEGLFEYKGQEIRIVDLPGTYSLSAFSPEEVIARDFIIHEKPDVVVTVVDAANLERNLYLAVQVLETEAPVILVLNMMDMAAAKHIEIQPEVLRQTLNVPVVQAIARKEEGLTELLDTIIAKSGQLNIETLPVETPRTGDLPRPNSPENAQTGFKIDYGAMLEAEIGRLVDFIGTHPHIQEKYPPRWVALKLLEEDRDLQIKLLGLQGGSEVIQQSKKNIDNLKTRYGDDLDVASAGRRYEWINQLVRAAVQQPASAAVSISDRLDSVLTHRYLGIPIFLVVMWVVFKLTAEVSAPYLDWIDGVITGPLTHWVIAILGLLGLNDTWVESLFVDGIIAGVGGVLVFVPVLTFLYLSLAILEDTGYMSRGAYVMDRVMNAIGLHGKSFLPMLVGFGCTVPAFYATRTLENEKDRILTGLLVPFMSCGARLPVYILFGTIFFPANPGTAVFGMYLLGILVALSVGIILRKTIFKSKELSGLIIELPPYRLPNMKSVGIYVQKRVGTFLKNATTIILGTSILIWILMATPMVAGQNFARVELEDSLFAAINRVTAPLLQPLGFGNWQSSGALLTGFVAKEVVVSTLSQVYDVEPVDELEASTTFSEDLTTIFVGFGRASIDTVKSLPLIVGIDLFAMEAEAEPTALMNAIRTGFEASSAGHTTLAALAFMVFVLLYTPCMVAIAAERQELGMQWAWVSIFGQLALAWAMALIVFQGGVALGLG